MSDKIIRSTGEKLPIRLVVCDLTEVANDIGKRHGAKAWSLELLADTIIASSFLSAALKSPGSVSFQASFSGDISAVQADTNPLGLIRANISSQECQSLGEFEPALSPQLLKVKKFSNKGTILSEGIVEMANTKIAPSLATYLLQSEQVKSAVMIESKWKKSNSNELEYAYGFYVEAFPDINQYEMDELEENIREIVSLEKYKTTNGLDLDGLLQQIFKLNTWQIHREITPVAYCPCSPDKIEKSLISLGLDELQSIVDDGENIEMSCDYCKKKYNVTLDKLEELRDSLL